MNVHSSVDYYAAHTNVDAYLRTVSSLIPGNPTPCSGGKARRSILLENSKSASGCVAAVLNIPSPGSVGPIPFVAFTPFSNPTAH